MKNFKTSLGFILIFFAITSLFCAFTYTIYKSQDPELILKKELASSCKDYLEQAFFSPDDNVRDKLIQLIENEKQAISIAIYTLTDKEIADALVDAHKRNINIEIVSDRMYGSERYSRIPLLANHKISLWVYQVPLEQRSLMHHKFAIFYDNIFNKSLLWTGSFNFTKSASISNQENVIITENKEIISKYKEQFKKLKERALLISGSEKTKLVDYKLNEKNDINWKKIINKLLKWIDWLLKGKWLHYYNFSLA